MNKMKKAFSIIAIFALAIVLVSCASGIRGKPKAPPLGAVTFPAYELENPENNAYIEKINNTPKFKVKVDWPPNCEYKNSKGDEIEPTGDFQTPVYIYSGEKFLGYIAFDVFNPDIQNVPQSDYYKAVYSKLRNSSTFNWTMYTPVKTTENTETATASIRYIAPADIEKYQGNLPNAPVNESYGILSYNKELGVYVGIALMPETLTKETVIKMAESVTITKVD